MVDALSTATAGLRSASDRFDRAAVSIAENGVSSAPGDVVGSIVDLIQARISVESNAAVARSAAESSRRLLDILV